MTLLCKLQLLIRLHIFQVVVGDVGKVITEDVSPSRPLLVHGFSVGAYLFSELLVLSEKEENADLKQRITQGRVAASCGTLGFRQCNVSLPIGRMYSCGT